MERYRLEPNLALGKYATQRGTTYFYPSPYCRPETLEIRRDDRTTEIKINTLNSHQEEGNRRNREVPIGGGVTLFLGGSSGRVLSISLPSDYDPGKLAVQFEMLDALRYCRPIRDNVNIAGKEHLSMVYDCVVEVLGAGETAKVEMDG